MLYTAVMRSLAVFHVIFGYVTDTDKIQMLLCCNNSRYSFPVWWLDSGLCSLLSVPHLQYVCVDFTLSIISFSLTPVDGRGLYWQRQKLFLFCCILLVLSEHTLRSCTGFACRENAHTQKYYIERSRAQVNSIYVHWSDEWRGRNALSLYFHVIGYRTLLQIRFTVISLLMWSEHS